MKKRLLITSIVMMLVVAVALSTATYAWFTSNTSVKADAVVLTAATMSGEAILITHNADGTEASQRIFLSTTSDKLYPATPNTATAFTTFTGSIANIASNFQNLLQDGTGNYTVPELAEGDVSLYKDTFYVFNKGFQSTTLVPTVTINYNSDSTTSAMAAQSARIAIIERVPSAEVAINTAITANMSTYTLKGIWQFDTTATAAIYKQITNEEFSATAAYYSRTGAGTTESPYAYTALTGENKVTADNYSEKVTAGLFIISGNTAASGANGNYGATSSSSTYVNSNISYTPSAFTAIGAATSGNHIANEYSVIVWLEGWDADCTNQITAGAFNVAVDFVTAPRGN